jgi:hypothetical protein
LDEQRRQSAKACLAQEQLENGGDSSSIVRLKFIAANGYPLATVEEIIGGTRPRARCTSRRWYGSTSNPTPPTPLNQDTAASNTATYQYAVFSIVAAVQPYSLHQEFLMTK